MKLHIGDRVVLKDSGERGAITDILDNGQLLIDVDGLCIPVKAGDVVNDKSHTGQTDDGMEKVKENDAVNTKHTPSTSARDVLLCFIPALDEEEMIDSYHVYLVNQSDEHCHFRISYSLRQEQVFQLAKPLARAQSFFLAEVMFDELNEHPQFDVWLQFTYGEKTHKRVKPKAKTLAQQHVHVPVLDCSGYMFRISIPKAQTEEEKPQESEQAPTVDKDELIRQMFESNEGEKTRKLSQTWAPPPYKVDLHIDQLVADSSELSNAEILQMQLNTCEEAIEQALVRDQSELVIVHGVGKGKLKQDVHKLLASYQEVNSYKNEYHPLYGFGATFVWF